MFGEVMDEQSSNFFGDFVLFRHGCMCRVRQTEVNGGAPPHMPVLIKVKRLMTEAITPTLIKSSRSWRSMDMPGHSVFWGWMYHEGQGAPQDHAEAVKWYRKAADQGHAKAQYNLATMYA